MSLVIGAFAAWLLLAVVIGYALSRAASKATPEPEEGVLPMAS